MRLRPISHCRKHDAARFSTTLDQKLCLVRIHSIPSCDALFAAFNVPLKVVLPSPYLVCMLASCIVTLISIQTPLRYEHYACASPDRLADRMHACSRHTCFAGCAYGCGDLGGGMVYETLFRSPHTCDLSRAERRKDFH